MLIWMLTLDAAARPESMPWRVAQVSDSGCTYDAPQMAELLFSDASPAFVLAAHRLLRDDRTLFRQVGRLPPRYQPRAAAEVEALRAEHAMLAEVLHRTLAQPLASR